MRREFLIIVIAMLGLSSPARAGAKRSPVPPPELLGLRIGMSDLEVRKRLEKIGELGEIQPEAGGRKQIWNLRDKRYQTLNLRMSSKFELQWCTVYARSRKLRYSDVGDTTQARKVGRFIWVWSFPAAGAQPGYQVAARGTDPRYASSVALSAPLSGPPAAVPDAPADSIR